MKVKGHLPEGEGKRRKPPSPGGAGDEGCLRAYTYDELIIRDKLEQFREIETDLGGGDAKTEAEWP